MAENKSRRKVIDFLTKICGATQLSFKEWAVRRHDACDAESKQRAVSRVFLHRCPIERCWVELSFSRHAYRQQLGPEHFYQVSGTQIALKFPSISSNLPVSVDAKLKPDPRVGKLMYVPFQCKKYGLVEHRASIRERAVRRGRDGYWVFFHGDKQYWHLDLEVVAGELERAETEFNRRRKRPLRRKPCYAAAEVPDGDVATDLSDDG